MECQANDSKKLFKVFDATKRKRTRKKHEALEDTPSIVSDDSNVGCGSNARRVSSAKASFQDISTTQSRHIDQDVPGNRERESSMSIPRSPVETKRQSRSPRRHRRLPRDGVSLALKAGLVSTPRSMSPHQDREGGIDSVPRDQDSFIYAFLEEAIKRDKKKHRHSRKREGRRSGERGESPREHRHYRKHRDEPPAREDKPRKEEKPSIDQAVLLETFAKLYAQIQPSPERVPRSQSHKSLQCEVASRRGSYVDRRHQGTAPSRDDSKHNISPSRIRSHDDCRSRVQIRDKAFNTIDDRNQNAHCVPYENSRPTYASRRNLTPNAADDERQEYSLKVHPTRCYIDKYYRNPPVNDADYRGYHERRVERPYDDDKKAFVHKASRSFEVRDRYEEDRPCRRTARSDGIKERSYDGEYRDMKRYEEKHYRDSFEPKDFSSRDYPHIPSKNHCARRHLDFERASIISRDEVFREGDKYSERERDSGLSVADGETSTLSGKSNYLKAVKQEITEQREAMDKMMKLWKELMRAFKGATPAKSEEPTKSVNETAAGVRESAAEQLRLWRECMRRYETVARDVGDTDARLMEEINKQRSEMAEMATMWQECLQRYRDMTNDFNSLKQQLVTSESPTRLPPAPAPALVCAEGEGPPPAHYRLPSNYPQHIPGAAPYMPGGPLRARASAPPPPPWWWAERGPSPQRRSSPDSRASRERPRRHKDRERDDTRYKDKSKPSGARSEHRRRKR